MKIDQRSRNLLIVLAILAPIALWRYTGPAVTRFFSGDGPLLGGPQRAIDVATLDVLDLRIDALQSEAHDYQPGRNIFRPYTPPPPPPPPPPPRVEQVYTPPPPPPPFVQPPPPFNYELVGIMGPDSRRIAVLNDGEIILNVLRGETIEEKFTIDRIGFESIDVRFIGFPDVPPERVEIEE